MTKSEKTRQFIIEQSAAIVNKKGMAGTTLSDIMEATKLAKGGIYGNFESKDEICMEVFDYLNVRLSRGIDHALNDKKTAREKLFALLDFYASIVSNIEMGGCPLLNFGTEADDTNPEFKQRVAKAIKKSQQRIYDLLEEGKDRGEFGKRTDAEAFSIKMFTMIEGAIFTTRVTNNKGVMKTVVDILKKEIRDL